ncbi:MAG: endolytic transglycosylase MltG [Candidatus Gracilibacteria bacterium]|nr:endolytic transglycosylase MltG [Candidatus Gracilibacteria bacterium]
MEHKKGSFLGGILKILFFLGIIGGILFGLSYKHFKNKVITDEVVLLHIESGESFQDVLGKMNIDPFYFRIYRKLNDLNPTLQAGNFQIPENATIQIFLESLKTPIFIEEKITFLEGWNIFDIDEYLTGKDLISSGEYISYVESVQNIQKKSEIFPYLSGLQTLEGYLYPDTYNIDRNNFSISYIVHTQLQIFDIKVYQPLFLQTDLTHENFQSVINLASIVEKEEKQDRNKKTVAGILKKRLKLGWMIGADITVCYPHRLTAQECKLVVSKYIHEKNEYNTRTMRGLPKTPIGNPSFITIEATLNDKETPYFFYLHDKQGNIHYARDNAEHTRNKYNYLR